MNTKEMIAVMQAYEDGKQIRRIGRKSGFCEIEDKPSWNWDKFKYEIMPTKKPVDLSVLIDSGIDCEFANEYQDFDVDECLIDKLHCIAHEWYHGLWDAFKYCRPRMNHIHAWQGGECPLPEGFRVKCTFRDPLRPMATKSAEVWDWEHDGVDGDIIAFEVVGIADGWRYPYDEE